MTRLSGSASARCQAGGSSRAASAVARLAVFCVRTSRRASLGGGWSGRTTLNTQARAVWPKKALLTTSRPLSRARCAEAGLEVGPSCVPKGTRVLSSWLKSASSTMR